MTTEAHAALYRLMTWLSPAYPVGAFSYSQGLETAIAARHVIDRKTLTDWLEDIATGGTLWSDALVFCRAHDAASRSQWSRLAEIAAFAICFQPAQELKDDSCAQGEAFLGISQTAWPCAALDGLARALNGPCPYPVAVAAAAAGHKIDQHDALAAFTHALAANLVSVAVRIVPLGQSDGQRVLAALEGTLAQVNAAAQATPLDDLATNCLMADIMAMRHETQHTRLFRS